MRTIKMFFALVAMFVTLGSTSVFAQEDGNRDANGYVVKGPYLTNGGGSNWFFGIGGGFDTTFGVGIDPLGEFKPANNWTAEAFIGKWFTPAVGVRAGYKGGMTNFAYDTELYKSGAYGNGEQVRFGYAHGDFMWNISNALSGYKETRTWDIIPYVGAGLYGLNNGYTLDRFALNAGIYNEFRLGNVTNLYVDLNLISTGNTLRLKDVETGKEIVTHDVPYIKHPVYMPTATVGVTFNLGKKKNFDRYTSVAPVPVIYPFTEDDYKNLQKKVKDLEEENALLMKGLEECRNSHKDTVTVKETVTDPGALSLYFERNKAVLAQKEINHLYDYVETVMSTYGDRKFTVTGCADAKTGTYKHNKKLSQKRADYVKGLLVKAGIGEELLVVQTAEPGTLYESNDLNRVVIVD